MLRKLALVLIALTAFDAQQAHALQPDKPWSGQPVGHISARVYTSAPAAFVDFCNRYPEDCQLPAKTNNTLTLTQARMKELSITNADVNDSLFFNSDVSTQDIWDYPQDGIGDCEDFVIEKRKRLMDLGWPEDSLLITLVRLKNPDFAGRTGHAVLTVRTDSGDYILDNNIRGVVSWNIASQVFEYVMIQTPISPLVWALVDTTN